MSNFIHTTSGTGFFSTKRTVTWASSGLNALASGSRAISDTTADTGSFTQSSFSSAQYGTAYLTVVTAGWTPTAGGCFACWWLPSYDGGSTYETESRTTPSTTVPALARAPDFIIPVYTGGTALSVGDVYFAQGPFAFPYVQSKLVVQNMTGAATGAGAHTIIIGGFADTFA